jgi:uncharacterized protein YjdB
MTATGSPTTLAVGSTLQFAAKCTYSNSQVTDCTVPDIYGNGVTAWNTSLPGYVSLSTSGLATAVAAGASNLTASIGTVVSPIYMLTATVTVTLTGLSLNTTGGVTGLFVGATNHLVATCLYSDSSTTNCTSTDSHGNIAGNYLSTTPAHATVNNTTGLITGVAPGTTTFTATSGGHMATSPTLTVLAVPTGTYTITITGPVTFSGTVTF